MSAQSARSSDSGFLLSIFSDKTFQAREIRRVVMLSTLYLLVTTALLGVFYYQLLGNLVEGVAPMLFVSEDVQLVNDAVPGLQAMLTKWVLAMLAINVVLTMALGVYITRRLGHPLLAIKRSLREIGQGNLDVRLRAGDSKDFGELADELMNAQAAIREQIAAAKAEVAQVEQPEISGEELTQAMRSCKLALDYFQVDGQSDSAANDAADRAA